MSDVDTPAPVETVSDTHALWISDPRWEGAPDFAHGMTTRHFPPSAMTSEERIAAIRVGLGMNDAVSVIMDQAHGARVVWLGGRSRRRAENRVLRLPDTDAVVTDQPGLLLHISTADCVPILAIDRTRRIIGAAHAGWRGTVAKIAAKLMREMDRHGADLDRTEVWLGPSIGPCCFEVGEDVLKPFKAINNWWSAIDLRRRRIDLALVNRLQIARTGVPPDSMSTSRLCTRCRSDLLFSHRAEPDNPGRMLAVIGLRPQG
jgi:purine-nucleoside/S-methyl-5'-thioadenosine phosphorylase / adenosine deaminase